MPSSRTINTVKNVDKSYSKASFLGQELHMISDQGYLYLTNGEDRVKIGTAKKKMQKTPIFKGDAYLRASQINESTNAKGTGMGFSSFIHLLAICCLASTDAVLEPVAGNDFDDHAMSFEMTGENWETRKTKSDFVINKYIVVQSCLIIDEDLRMMLKISYCEDIGDFTYMVGTAFDQGESPYREVFLNLADELKKVSLDNVLNLSNMLKSWYSRTSIKIWDAGRPCSDKSNLEKVIEDWGEKRNGKTYHPCPYRVLPGELAPDYDSKEHLVDINYSTTGEMYSTYRTLLYSDNWRAMCLETSPNVVPNPYEEVEPTLSWIHKKMEQYDMYASCCVEADLLSKINGKQGCFYSRHSRAGIVWKRLKNNSLIFLANYYVKGKPKNTCGLWSPLENHEGWFKSPTFKVDNEDIAYSIALPGRFLAMVSATLSYCNDAERVEIIKKLCLVIAVVKNSSWQTSALAGDFRFMVLNMISQTGDRQKEHDDIAALIRNKLRFSDYALLRLVIDSDEKICKLKNVTPFFQFPMRFMNVEKDLTLMMMWRPRKDNVPFDVVVKPIKALIKEQEERSELLKAYENNLICLKKVNAGTFTQDDFDKHMNESTNCVHLNLVMFIGLAEVACKGNNFGARQKHAGVKISTLISYKHCMTSTGMTPEADGVVKVKATRQINNFVELLENKRKPDNIFALVCRVLRDPPTPYLNLYVPKNGKSSRREVPQFDCYRRLGQMLSEQNVTIYIDQEPVDKKTDPNKFKDFALAVHDMLKKGGVSSSEDKSGWCHNMHPPAMGLAVSLVARLIGSTGMVTAAAKLLVDFTRWTVLPPGATDEMLNKVEFKKTVTLLKGKTAEETIMVKHQRSMQQGQDQGPSAIVGTVFVKGLDMIHCETMSDIKETYIVTTADDENRTAVLIEETSFNPQKVLDDYVQSAVLLLNQALMENNFRKWMVSDLIAEFNNATAGPNGMFTAVFSQCFLCLQPLRGDNPLDDIMSVVSNARQSIPWGCSIDIARVALYYGLSMLRQKWLFTNEDVDLLISFGLIPTTDEEIIQGFHIREKSVKLKLIQMMSSEQVESLLDNAGSLYNSMRQFRIRDSKKKMKFNLSYPSKIWGIDRAVRQVVSSTRIMGRMGSAFMRPLPVEKRLKVKNDFMAALAAPPLKLSDERLALLDLFPTSYEVTIIARYPTVRNNLPIKQGDKASIKTEIDMNWVLARKFGEINLYRKGTKEELMLSNSEPDAIKKQEMINFQTVDQAGFGFGSYTGAPLFRFHNGKLFKRPMHFTFRVDFELRQQGPMPLHFDQRDFVDFKPTWLSEKLLQKAKSSKCLIAFGIGENMEGKFALVCSKKGVIDSIPITDDNVNYMFADSAKLRKKVLVSTRREMSPIQIQNYNIKDNLWYNNFLNCDVVCKSNYGNYINTSSNSAKSIRRQLFEFFDSNEPNWVSNYRVEYPYFSKNATEFEMCRYNDFIGHKSVCMVKLNSSDNAKMHQTIDLRGDVPKLSTEHDYEEEEGLFED